MTAGKMRAGEVKYFFSDAVHEGEAPWSVDVLTLCRDYFVLLLEIVYDCYVVLGRHIDPQQYFTKENFADLGRSIDDGEREVWGWVMQSHIDDGFTEDDRWHALRERVGECQINHLFYGYLGRPTPQPQLPEEFHDFDYGPEDKGWGHVPAGFESQEAYWEAYPERVPEERE